MINPSTSGLDDLREHWGDAYVIQGTAMALRRDNGSLLIADNIDTLRDLIRADYFSQPVTRRGGHCVSSTPTIGGANKRMRNYVTPLIASLAIAASVAACGGSTGSTTNGQSAAHPAVAAKPPTCKQIYAKWKNGPARPLAKKMIAGMQKTQGGTDDIPVMLKGLESAGRYARELRAYPMPSCADPKHYWSRALNYLVATGDNARQGGGFGGMMLAEIPLKKAVQLMNGKLTRELKTTLPSGA